jgi:hypothetical protein
MGVVGRGTTTTFAAFGLDGGFTKYSFGQSLAPLEIGIFAVAAAAAVAGYNEEDQYGAHKVAQMSVALPALDE